MRNFDYLVHTDLNLIEVRPIGVVQTSHIVSYAEEVLSQDIVTEGTIEYYDLSEMTELSCNYESASGIKDILRQWLARGWQGSLYCTTQEHHFGMIRMIGAIVESIQDAPGAVIVPRREPAALDEVRDLIGAHSRIWCV